MLTLRSSLRARSIFCCIPLSCSIIQSTISEWWGNRSGENFSFIHACAYKVSPNYIHQAVFLLLTNQLANIIQNGSPTALAFYHLLLLLKISMYKIQKLCLWQTTVQDIVTTITFAHGFCLSTMIEYRVWLKSPPTPPTPPTVISSPYQLNKQVEQAGEY